MCTCCTGEDPVVQWLLGTGLRPILEALPEAEAAEFITEFAASDAPRVPAERATARCCPYRRIFAVGHRP